MGSKFESITHIVAQHAHKRSAHDAIIFLERGETEAGRMTYAELDAAVTAFAAGFERLKLAGKPVVIAMPPGILFTVLFLAALHVGAIAIPVPVPDTDRNRARLLPILQDAKAAAVITTAELAPRFRAFSESPAIFDAEELRGAATAPVSPQYTLASDHPALVQYTSGSTGTPKGIVITHGNLIANQKMIAKAFAADENIVSVSWLPHFHDMGLMGTMLQPLFVGGTTVLMAPKAFVQKPIRWLRAIGKYRGTVTASPSFGFELCTRTVSAEQATELDLSSWTVAFCGAEPIRARILTDFAQRFAPAKFSSKTFLPCYGLAETTLITSSVPVHTGFSQREIPEWRPAARRTFVSCGRPVEGSSLVLRDGTSLLQEAGDATGEICVGGPHLSPGYWDGQRQTAAPFSNTFFHRGTIYLPTGDIGAVVGGQLYVVDRLKDSFILYGTKIHAADVEATALEDNEIRAAAAFAVDDGKREQLVVLCEFDKRSLATVDPTSLSKTIGKRIAEAHGTVPALYPVPYGALPRTSSGKIQRFAARTSFLSGEFRLPKVGGDAE